MDKACKLQISTSIVLHSTHVISGQLDLAQMALCHQFLTPPTTRKEPWGTGLKLLPGLSLETCPNDVESNWSQIRNAEVALNNLLLNLHFTPFHQTEGSKTSLMKNKQ